jgi:alpha-tubulin suppressor-like RCC1 family protein
MIMDRRLINVIGPYTQISAGAYHTCALKPDGTTPICWGNNDYGQLSAPGTITYKHISAGYLHTCGIRSDGQPVCWGLNADGQSTPVSGQYTEINAGGYFTCGMLADGMVNCWGRNNHGQSSPPSAKIWAWYA